LAVSGLRVVSRWSARFENHDVGIDNVGTGRQGLACRSGRHDAIDVVFQLVLRQLPETPQVF
jgi:hypothetical protein